jgi:hypothetical protein
MMSTVTKPLLSPALGGTNLCADYFRFVAELSCGPQAKYLRRRRAVAFLDSCPSPVERMARHARVITSLQKHLDRLKA